MGQGGVDLELEEPYHAVLVADVEAAAPFLGDAPPPPEGRPLTCREQVCATLFALAMIAATIWAEYLIYVSAPSISVHLTGLDGINLARPARVVSPAFNLTLLLSRTCADRADVAVSYAGAALAWARVALQDCAAERTGRDVAVVARGAGVGLSRPIRERMAAEQRRYGAVDLDVEVVIYNDGPDPFLHPFAPDNRDKVMLCKLRTDGRQPSESPPCPWYSLMPVTVFD